MSVKRVIQVFIIALFALASVVLADQFESDDSYTNATWISVDGIAQTHNFSYSGDIDYVKFNATQGDKYVIETLNLTDIDTTDTYIRLYDTDGTTDLAENDDIIDFVIRTSRIVWNAPSDGIYYLRVWEWGNNVGGIYNISVAKQGTLVPYLIGMSSGNISAYKYFNFSAGVSCVGGICKDVQVILDPIKAKVDKDVLERLNMGEFADVIVVLDDTSNPSHPYRTLKIASDIKQRKDDVNKLQMSVLDDISYSKKGDLHTSEDVDFELVHQYETINAFAGTINSEGMSILIEHPDVLAIYADPVLHTTLDDSIPYINADDVWLKQYSGNNITGDTQAICVVDSGIDYTHDYLGNCTTEQFISGNCAKIPGGYDYYNTDNDPIDDQDHGTHVAGIIASTHPTYRGVSPGVRLLALKACSNTGSCSGSKMIASVDWCNANKDLYNISVITMSIGDSGEYGPDAGVQCPSWLDSSLSTSRDLGIFISVAAGNEGHTSGISYPGCSPYVMGVGAVDEADGIYYNRGELMDILAPGRVIYSTVLNDSWGAKSGTSMATPHIAGAAALINDYFIKRYNKTLSPEDLMRQIIHNAPVLYDSGTGLNFSRVDVLRAIEAKGPVSTTIGDLPFYTISSNPHDSSCLEWMEDGDSCNMTWVVNATGDFGTYEFFVIYENEYQSISGERINLTISNSAPVLSSPSVSPAVGNNHETFNFSVIYTDVDDHAPVSITVNIGNDTHDLSASDVSDTIFSDGKTYYYATMLNDSNYTSFFNASDYFVTSGSAVLAAPNVSDFIPPAISVLSPVDNTNTSSALQHFVVDVVEDFSSVVNCTLVVDGVIVNQTIINGSDQVNLSYTLPASGAYSWNVTCDDGSQTNTSSTRVITYDAIAPVLAIYGPVDGSASQTDTPLFTFNVTDNIFTALSCSLIVDSAEAASNASVLNSTRTSFSVELEAGSASWTIECFDPSGNDVSSSARTLFIPSDSAGTAVNATANQSFNLNSSGKVQVVAVLASDIIGSWNISEFNTNPAGVSTSEANGFAELAFGLFVDLSASDLVNDDLSWYVLNISYSDDDLPSGIDESAMTIFYFNGSSGLWEEEVSEIDTSSNHIWANISHLSIFSVGGDELNTGGGSGGGGGGSSSSRASSEPVQVTPGLEVSVVESPKNQEISILYDNSSYLFKVVDFSGSLMTLKKYSDGSEKIISNGLVNGYDLDDDGRFDVNIGYSGKYDNNALVIIYLIDKPDPIPVLPPAPRKSRAEPENTDLKLEIAQEGSQTEVQSEDAGTGVEPVGNSVVDSEHDTSEAWLPSWVYFVGAAVVVLILIFLAFVLFKGRPLFNKESSVRVTGRPTKRKNINKDIDQYMTTKR